MSRVLFKIDPSIVVTERTAIGPGIDQRAPRRRLADGPFLAAFDAGMHEVRDIAIDPDRVRLVRIDSEHPMAVLNEAMRKKRRAPNYNRERMNR